MIEDIYEEVLDKFLISDSFIKTKKVDGFWRHNARKRSQQAG